jgi:hypothetical protein
MRPFDQIPKLERVTALDAPAGVLDTLSGVISKPEGLRRNLAGEPFGHSAHPMLVQIPIGAWVSAGWLDCLPRTERSATILTAVGIAAALPAVAQRGDLAGQADRVRRNDHPVRRRDPRRTPRPQASHHDGLSRPR